MIVMDQDGLGCSGNSVVASQLGGISATHAQRTVQNLPILA
jgi:hypothetical protein